MATEKNSIKEQLILLAELQQADTEIGVIEKELAHVQCVLEGFDTRLAEMNAQVVLAGQSLDELKKRYRLDESEIRGIDDAITKTQSKLNAVKTNKEYQAMLKAIEDLKLKRSHIEDQMLATLEQIEAAEATKRSVQADLEDMKNDIADQKTHIISEADAQRQKVISLQQERERTWNQLPSKWQNLFRRAVQQGKGVGVAAVVEAVCQACRVNLPPQQYIDLMRMNSMLLCPSCQRIIYPDTIWNREQKRKGADPKNLEK